MTHSKTIEPTIGATHDIPPDTSLHALGYRYWRNKEWSNGHMVREISCDGAWWTQGSNTDTLALIGMSDHDILLQAPSYQGGHSRVGGEIADRLGIPFPLRMSALASAARARGFDPGDLWPWWAKMHRERQAMEASDAK